MADYPDWTTIFHLVGTDIMLPVDIQAQYLTLEIDIVAQSVGDITIDIAAQSIGNLDVNIAASAVTINVAVTGTANIQITAQSVGVYLQPEWSALQGTDKSLRAIGEVIGSGIAASVQWKVTAEKGFFITHLSGSCRAVDAGDRDLNQMCEVSIEDTNTGEWFAETGGNGGVSVDLSKPIVIPYAHTVEVYITNASAHHCKVFVNAFGYLI